MTRNWQLLGDIFTHIEKEDLTTFLDDDSTAYSCADKLRHLELLKPF